MPLELIHRGTPSEEQAQCGDTQPRSSGSSLGVLDRRTQCDSLLADPTHTHPDKKDQLSTPTPMFWDSCSQLVTEGDRVGDGGSRPAHNNLTSLPLNLHGVPLNLHGV